MITLFDKTIDIRTVQTFISRCRPSSLLLPLGRDHCPHTLSASFSSLANLPDLALIPEVEHDLPNRAGPYNFLPDRTYFYGALLPLLFHGACQRVDQVCDLDGLVKFLGFLFHSRHYSLTPGGAGGGDGCKLYSGR